MAYVGMLVAALFECCQMKAERADVAAVVNNVKGVDDPPTFQVFKLRKEQMETSKPAARVASATWPVPMMTPTPPTTVATAP